MPPGAAVVTAVDIRAHVLLACGVADCHHPASPPTKTVVVAGGPILPHPDAWRAARSAGFKLLLRRLRPRRDVRGAVTTGTLALSCADEMRSE